MLKICCFKELNSKEEKIQRLIKDLDKKADKNKVETTAKVGLSHLISFEHEP